MVNKMVRRRMNVHCIRIAEVFEIAKGYCLCFFIKSFLLQQPLFTGKGECRDGAGCREY